MERVKASKCIFTLFFSEGVLGNSAGLALFQCPQLVLSCARIFIYDTLIKVSLFITTICHSYSSCKRSQLCSDELYCPFDQSGVAALLDQLTS